MIHFKNHNQLLNCLFILFCILSDSSLPVTCETSIEEEKYGVKYASDCEVCKYFTLELTDRLRETGRTHDVIQTGYSIDESKKKKKPYAKSELRLVESLDGICDRLLQYNVHKERSDSSRFAKGMSETFRTLHGLVDKGVKVDLGIPHELWDKPSAEVTHMKTQCESMLEKYEDAIETWYWKHEQDIPLYKYLCVDRALAKGDTGCLDEGMDQTIKEQAAEKVVKQSPFHGNEFFWNTV